MAGAAGYTAVLDANVLYPALLRDLLLSLADSGLYVARWTSTIEDEWVRSLIAEFPAGEAAIRATACEARRAIPDCLIEGYLPFAETLTLPDPDDRHVLAAAIVGHADAIVTSNIKDFPLEALAAFNIELQTPDEFVANQIMLNKIWALKAIKRMRARWKNPERTAQEMLDLMVKRDLPMTAAHLADAVELL